MNGADATYPQRIYNIIGIADNKSVIIREDTKLSENMAQKSKSSIMVQEKLL